MEGEEISAQAMFRRRFSPPDSPRTRMPPGRAPPTCRKAVRGSDSVYSILMRHLTAQAWRRLELGTLPDENTLLDKGCQPILNGSVLQRQP